MQGSGHSNTWYSFIDNTSIRDTSLIEGLASLENSIVKHSPQGLVTSIEEYNLIYNMENTKSPSSTINIINGLPSNCNKCDDGILMADLLDNKNKEIARDEAIIGKMDIKMEQMHAKFIQMFQAVNPEIDFGTCPNKFKERPSDSALAIWFTRMMNTNTTEEFIEVFENTSELNMYKNIKPDSPSDDLSKLISDMMMYLSELLKIYAIITDPESEDGARISETEALVIEPLMKRLRNIMLQISAHLNNKKRP
jgi:hypothetical protein